MIRHPVDADLPQLTALWQEAFGDSPEEAGFYLERRHRHENMLVDESAGQIHGMMSMLPLELLTPQKTLKARYVFAVATKKEYRGQGVSTRLIEEAHRSMQAAGIDASLLVPANPSLFEYYGKRGYQTAFSIDEAMIQAQDIKEPEDSSRIEPCSVEEYLQARDAFYRGSRLYARWDAEALRFANQYESAGLHVMLRMRIGARQAVAACVDRGTHHRVSELACDTSIWPEAMALIHRRLQAGRYLLRMQAGSLPSGSTRPFGMVHWFSKPAARGGAPAHLAFAKD